MTDNNISEALTSKQKVGPCKGVRSHDWKMFCQCCGCPYPGVVVDDIYAPTMTPFETADEIERLTRDLAMQKMLEDAMTDCIEPREGQTFEERAEELIVTEVQHQQCSGVETSAPVWKRMRNQVPANGTWIWWDYGKGPMLQRAQDFASEDDGYWIEATPPLRSPEEPARKPTSIWIMEA